MRKVEMFITPFCPYCKRAQKFIKKLIKEDEKYGKLKIKIIDERKKKAYASKHDYYFVPTIYVGGKKMHEGIPTYEDVKKALDAAL